MNLAHVGGSLSGGATVVLTPAGLTAPGKSTFTVAGHTLLEPKTVDFLSTRPTVTASDPGTARNGLKIVLANRVEEEGCCTVKAGNVIVDLSLRWPLSQPESVVDEIISLLQALVFDAGFVNQLKTGVPPVS